MITDQNNQSLVSKQPGRGLLPKITIISFFLLAVFFLLLGSLWVRLPAEGVKLHGTVDIGIDLLGTKKDVLWFGVFAVTIFLFNMGLALVMVKREKLASIYLVASTGIVLLLLIGTMVFLMRLNRII